MPVDVEHPAVEAPGARAGGAPPDAAALLPLASLRHPSIATWSVALLALIATFVVLYFAQALFVPVVLAALFHTALSPVVRAADRVGFRPPVTAVVLLVVGLGLCALGVYYLAAPMRAWLEALPAQIQEIRTDLRGMLENVERVAEAAGTLDEMTKMSDGVGPVQVAPVTGSPLLSGTTTLLGQGFATLVLLFAMIAGHDSFLRSLVTVLPNFGEKRVAVTVMRSIGEDVSTYLLTISVINVCLGVVIAGAMWALGLPNPLLWGAMATVFNFVPYAGAMAGVAVVGLVASASFDGPARPLLAMGSYGALTTLEGGVLTPLILGRSLRLRAVVVLVWLLLWGYLWGIVGALIAIPMLVVLKILCEHVPAMRPLGAFLGQMDGEHLERAMGEPAPS